MAASSPKHRVSWPLWLQILLALLAALVLVNLLTAWLVGQMEGKYLLKQVERQSNDCFSILAATAIDAVITEDHPLLATIADQSMVQSPNILKLSILNEQGDLLVQRERSTVIPDPRTHYFSGNLTFEGELYGTITIESNIEPVYVEINHHIGQIQLFISTMLFLLTSLTLLLVNRLVINPIQNISHYLTQLSKKAVQPSLLLNRVASRELQLLAVSVNSLKDMMHQRDLREQDLIKARKELEIAHDKALCANRAKSGFLAAMSHEIRTPMNAVLGILGLLRDTPLSKHQKHLVTTGQDSGDLLLGIINDILEFSKMEADKLQLEKSSFDVQQLLTGTIELLKPQANFKGIQLQLVQKTSLPQYAIADTKRLRQILLNLINNAIKFTPRGTVCVSVAIERTNESTMTLSCAVTDTGIGIPKEFQASLFKEFTMVDQSHSRLYEGTGLGLAICKRLINLMNGDIRVSSETGKGSTFEFNVELGISDVKQTTTNTTEKNHNLVPKANTRVLLTEDNPANQMVIKTVLEYAGLQVDIAANGKKAIKAVSSDTYDIILMDISMPEMDGMEATRMIRQLSSSAAKIPIIALTAHALPGDKQRFLQAGMNDYLTKPLNRTQSLDCIARWTATLS